MQAVLGASVLGRGQAGSLSRPTSGSSLRVPSLARPSPRHDRRAALAPVAAAPAAVAAAAAALTPAAVFDVTTVLVLPFYAAMIAAPGVQLTQRLFSKAGVLTAAAALYGLLLALWRPLPAITAVVEGAAAAVRGAAGAPSGLAEALRSALPSVPAFAALFGSAEVTAVAWVHLLVLDLLQARWVLGCDAGGSSRGELDASLDATQGSLHAWPCWAPACVHAPASADSSPALGTPCLRSWVYKDGQRNNIPVWHSGGCCDSAAALDVLCRPAAGCA